MKIVVVGLGSIGCRHLGNVAHCDPRVAVTVWHQQRGAGDAPQRIGSPSVVYSLTDALAFEPTAALITGPASSHVATALEFVRRGVHVFVEKPLASSLDGVSELIECCRARGVLLMVGYCFRFYAPLNALRDAVRSGLIGRIVSVRAEVGQYLPDWRPSRDYRETVSARKDQGGGALLELSHEIDYVRWIVGEVSAVSARTARLSNLDLDVEDTAEVVVDFADGALASIHLDMLQRVAFRGCRIVGTEGTLTWDAQSHTVRHYAPGLPDGVLLHQSGPGAFDEMYRAELSSFLRAVETGEPAGASGDDGRRVLEIIAAARQSSAEGRTVIV